ncbi:hypothetical protein C5Y96_17265 [Blastopirellula marina]|uniref:SAF domain-containing protein n=2 Tax=Pirellulales TaxID=2691354 RepID=A0A2S8F556_9BACT|nr:hypothetical protein C5Y96_17265 [Blastopirellula marina]RCS47830.1 hypothetical protein DTL36_17290 [Bremerella cremea]
MLLPLLLVLVLPVMLFAGTLGTLMALGIEIPFMKGPEPPTLQIPANPRPLAAYHRVGRNDLVDFETGQIRYMKMPPRSAVGSKLKGTTLSGEVAEGVVQAVATKEIQGATYPVFLLASGEEVPLPNVDEVGGAYLRLGNIIGRVLDREKSPNFGFTEGNFLPEGTRSGTVGGVPTGMKAYTLEASKLVGIHGLNIGDKFDLLASVPVEKVSSGGALSANGLLSASLIVDAQPARSRDQERSETHLIASDAQLITPVYRRAKTTSSSSLLNGTSSRTAPVEEVVLAVHELDVPSVTEVLGMNVPLTVVAHSGRPVAEQDNTAPEGMVRVVVTPRDTIPYTELNLSQLVPGGAREPRTILLAEEQVKDLKILARADQIVGRVVRRAKSPGTFFTENDFFPMGTPAGLAAAVPAGQVAYTIDASKMNGIAGLGLGDHFDLIATRPVDFQKMAQRIGAKDLAVSSAIREGALRLDAGAHTQVVLRGATVIAPPGSSAMRMHGTVTGSKKQEIQTPMMIAVSPKEINKLSEVLATGTQLTAILRAVDDADATPIQDSADPTEAVHVLDSMIGGDREPIVFLGERNSTPAKPLNLRDLLPREEVTPATDKAVQ